MSSTDRSRPVLIAAASGRALAASARRAGYMPLVADAFGDEDTLAAAAGHERVDLIDRPRDDEKLIGALERLAGGRDCAGIVCGSGFEDRAPLLERIGQRWALLGNSAETVARLKDPLAFAAICRAANIPHPETSRKAPVDGERWLVKRIGGAGGWHIRPAGDAETAKDVYFQRHVGGNPASALVLGDGSRVMVLGFSAQWSAPTQLHPFRYGGAVRPAALDDELRRAMTGAIERLNALVSLTGLNSVDFLVDGNASHLLEVNPRPGATFDLFEPDEGSLFALHVEACAGRLPAQSLVLAGAMAGAIVYAERAIAKMPALSWPDWTKDRPVAGSSITCDGPLCSVFSRAPTAAEAKKLVQQRVAKIHAMLSASVS
jgi:predicted ATP-grasp superfamily ATP-dependent carboligase